MKNLTWQNPEQLFVAQELINKVKSKCCGIKVYQVRMMQAFFMLSKPYCSCFRPKYIALKDKKELYGKYLQFQYLMLRNALGEE